MDFGLEVYNDNDILQINSAYKNHFLVGKGIYRMTGANFDFNGPIPPGVRHSGRNPFIALKNSRYIRTVRELKSAGEYEFRFIWNEFGPHPSEWDLEYFIFDYLPPTPSLHGMGLQTFDENGYPVYDSGLVSCNVVQFIQQYAVFDVLGRPTTRTYPIPVQNFALVTCQQAYWLLDVAYESPNGQLIPGTEYYSIRAKIEGSSVSTMDIMENNFGGMPPTSIKQPYGAFLVIDLGSTTI